MGGDFEISLPIYKMYSDLTFVLSSKLLRKGTGDYVFIIIAI
ncbi:hypothetical protein GCM10007111_25950 [Virgibacillus kapii]|uniref:Uncharacterized protein n=2 Tax=Virgibacillus TaxID=84406 RepID=A0A024Q9P7_9BACI|nr:hypothetical protein GCM10007111_25950 [Virgibacillus kapii]CDQ39219.1 hypothetical protein BN990_01505 [Virgibacillus massiliensis]